MNTSEKILGGLAILILLWLLSRKKLPTGSSSVKLLDPNTGLPIVEGSADNAIGEVVLPPGVPNDASSSSFQYAINNPEVPVCPEGFTPVIDPSTNKAYCTLPS